MTVSKEVRVGAVVGPKFASCNCPTLFFFFSICPSQTPFIQSLHTIKLLKLYVLITSLADTANEA